MAGRIIILVALLTMSLGVRAAPQDKQYPNNPYIGTWMEDTARTTYAPGQKPALLYLHKWEPWDVDGMKCTITIVNADGSLNHSTYFLKFDGNYYPVVGEERRDAISSTRLDAYTFQNSSRKDGKGGGAAGRHVFSKDGQTMTLVNSEGKSGRVYKKLF